jgi:hypothetical protein
MKLVPPHSRASNGVVGGGGIKINLIALTNAILIE